STRPSETRSFTSEFPAAMTAPFAFSASKNVVALASPHFANKAAAWKDIVPKCGLANATRPFQRGFVRSRIERGASLAVTRVVLYNTTRIRAANPVHSPLGLR